MAPMQLADGNRDLVHHRYGNRDIAMHVLLYSEMQCKLSALDKASDHTSKQRVNQCMLSSGRWNRILRSRAFEDGLEIAKIYSAEERMRRAAVD